MQVLQLNVKKVIFLRLNVFLFIYFIKFRKICFLLINYKLRKFIIGYWPNTKKSDFCPLKQMKGSIIQGVPINMGIQSFQDLISSLL